MWLHGGSFQTDFKLEEEPRDRLVPERSEVLHLGAQAHLSGSCRGRGLGPGLFLRTDGWNTEKTTVGVRPKRKPFSWLSP